MIAADQVPVSDIHWARAVRIIPSRFPPINVFESITDPADLDEVYRVESLTNDRLREQAGDISLVRPEDRVTGPGTTPIMAAFTHPSPSRFTDGTFGIFYASRDQDTAVEETCYRRELFCRDGRLGPIDLEMRVYRCDVTGHFRDLRGLRAARPELYNPTDYAASQRYGANVRVAHEDGICYESVRRNGGECIAAMKPNRISNCVQSAHLMYKWDGTKISAVGDLRAR